MVESRRTVQPKGENMKKYIYLGGLAMGVLAGIFLLKRRGNHSGSPASAWDFQTKRKNFGPFPPDIPDAQFENFLFI